MCNLGDPMSLGLPVIRGMSHLCVIRFNDTNNDGHRDDDDGKKRTMIMAKENYDFGKRAL